LSPAEGTGNTDRRTPLDLRTGLALTALVIGAAYVLVRADATRGYGAFAPAIAAAVWLLVWTLATLGSGRPIVRYLVGGDHGSWEDEVVAAIAGTGVLVVCAAGLAVLELFRPWPLLGILLLWAVVGCVQVFRRPIGGPQIDVRIGPLIGLAAVTALMATVVSPFYDQWHQHLGFPWVWLGSGSIHPLPNDWYSFMPVNSSLLYAYGLATLGSWSAQMIHWWSGVVTVIAIGTLAARSGNASARVWALWIFATTPVVLHLATTAGSDLVVGLFAAGAWISLLRTAEDSGHPVRWWTATGVCVGLAAGTKYIALGTVAIPVGIGSLVLHRPWRDERNWVLFVQRAAIGVVGAGLAFAPWALRNFIVTGNPLFPFANRVFASTLRQSFETAVGFSTTLSGLDTSLGHIAKGLDLGSFSASIDGFPSVGFAYLALVPLAVFMWPRLRGDSRLSALAAGAVAGVVFWLVTLHVSRYLVPVLVPAVAVLGSAVAGLLSGLPSRIRAAAVILVAIVVALTLAGTVTSVGAERLGIALGVTPAEPLLARWVSSTPAFDPVASLDEDARILMVAEARPLGFERPVVFNDPYRDPLLLDLARNSSNAKDLAAHLEAMGLTHVLANRWEAVRSARLRGHDRFFVVRDPEVQTRLTDFCTRCLEPIWSDRGLELYLLNPACTVPPSGGADLATW
jgi:hypothetical protein